ncbi:hypothetical protein EB796_006653 [Bugula neritina]|uniref:Sushi domain-containing protein n=1 Tax=Bugula neritina TaxID=10212 RepID=A0A7J7K8S8_BUGNE|nr:hypothetical protein EB796_006653 [Bugula neritina]
MRWLQVLQLLALLVFLSDAVEITTATAVIRCNPPARGETTRPVTNQTMSTGSSFEYQCNVGYECIDCNMTATCLNTGNWSIPPPNCSRMDCGPLPVGVNTEGISDEYNTKYLDYYRYRCLTGYTTNDTTVVQCLASKSWSHPPPTCHVRNCGTPANGTNTKPIPGNIVTLTDTTTLMNVQTDTNQILRLQ